MHAVYVNSFTVRWSHLLQSYALESVEMLEQWLLGPAAINSGTQRQMDRFCFYKSREVLKEHLWEQQSKYHCT
jgi:hypothetical protein